VLACDLEEVREGLELGWETEARDACHLTSGGLRVPGKGRNSDFETKERKKENEE
jgi:hypothetical protein